MVETPEQAAERYVEGSGAADSQRFGKRGMPRGVFQGCYQHLVDVIAAILADDRARVAKAAWRPGTETPENDERYLVETDGEYGIAMYDRAIGRSGSGWVGRCGWAWMGRAPDRWKPLPEGPDK